MIRRTQEDGVSLILVLVALVVFGLLVPVLGQFGSVNGVSGYVLKQQRFDRYLAEDGMQGAIAWLQAHRPGGRAFASCPEITSQPLAGTGSKYDTPVTVACQGLKDSGIPQQGDTTPAYALQTLGGAIDVSGGGSISTAGAWWANGDIDVHSGTTVDASQDYVGATGSCSNITGTPTRCDQGAAGGKVDPASDPRSPWIYDLPTPIPVDPPRLLDCRAIPASGVVAIDPGLHWQLPWFDKLTDGEDCPDVVLWFRPGTHVFDFAFYGADQNARTQWTIRPRGAQVAIVGGEPSGWSPTAGTSQVGTVQGLITSSAASACDETAAGSTMAFAADSALRVVAPARMEVCGAGSPQRLAVAQVTGKVPMDGVPVDATNPMGPDRVTSTNVSGFPTVPPDPNPLGASECIPGPCNPAQYASGTIRGDRAVGTVTMRVRNAVPRADLENARLRSLELALVHRESAPGDIDRMTVSVGGLPGSPQCTLVNGGETFGPSQGWTDSHFNCLLDDLQQPYTPVADLVVTLRVQLDPQRGGGNTPESDLSLDQVALVARYQRVAYRNSQPSDVLLRVDGGAAGRFDGTVHAPTGDVRFDLGGTRDTSTRRGVVARTITIRNLPNDDLWAPFSLPGGGTYTDRLVTLTATLDGKSDPDLTARVQFCDQHLDGGTPRAKGCEGTDPQGGPPLVLRWQPRF